MNLKAKLCRVIIPAVCVFLLAACHEEDPQPVPPKNSHAPRTLLIYMVAQNSLGYAGYHRKDSAEMMNGVKTLSDSDKVLLFIDDDRPPRLYEIGKNYERPKLLKHWNADPNSADTTMLAGMLRYMKSNYPSQSYGLVLWSHASGWIPGARSVEQAKYHSSARLRRRSPKSFGIDVGTDGKMSRDVAALGAHPFEMNIDDMASAIEKTGIHLRFIHFDCCQMQNIEVAYALRNTADYIAGSPMAIQATGAFYTDMFNKGYFSDDITDMGVAYTNYYENKGSLPYTENFGLVFSILRTDRLQAVADAVAEVIPRDLPEHSTAASPNYPNLSGVTYYKPFKKFFFYQPHNYDMNDAMRKILPNADFQKVKAALDEAIVYKFSTPRFYTGLTYFDQLFVDLKNYCGVSMFVPQAAYADVATVSGYGNLNEQFRKTAWYKAAGWQAAGW